VRSLSTLGNAALVLIVGMIAPLSLSKVFKRSDSFIDDFAIMQSF
jgi:hypothetical protein